MKRHQLPAYSPLGILDWTRAAVGALVNRGDPVEDLGLALKDRFSGIDAVLTDSGTAALSLALRASAREGAVAVPAYGCFDLATAAVSAEVSLVFYQLDPKTLAPAEESLAEALRYGVSAVLVANLFGYPVDWDSVRDLAGGAEVTFIEDAAQGIGSTWRDRPCGTLGDFTVLSFGRGKGWTGGGGGALLCREEGFGNGLGVPLSRKTGLRGWGGSTLTTMGQWLFGRPGLFWIPSAIPGLNLGETHYREPTPPGAISPFSAGLALGTAAKASAEVLKRQANARRLLEIIRSSGADEVLRFPYPLEGGTSSFLRLPVVGRPEVQDVLRSRQARRLGIARSYPRPLTELAQVEHLIRWVGDDREAAMTLAEGLFTLPTHSLVTHRDLSVIEAFLSKIT